MSVLLGGVAVKKRIGLDEMSASVYMTNVSGAVIVHGYTHNTRHHG